ncbi:MAG: hypothetical protein J5838_01495, partial [Desulfovibrio sp.]|nr:hypothetical protein [Desulfovibrio sp.]
MKGTLPEKKAFCKEKGGPALLKGLRDSGYSSRQEHEYRQIVTPLQEILAFKEGRCRRQRNARGAAVSRQRPLCFSVRVYFLRSRNTFPHGGFRLRMRWSSSRMTKVNITADMAGLPIFPGTACVLPRRACLSPRRFVPWQDP